ncbi:hypothetical protein [Roseisolibacter agri]|uniref:Uncharacterized protein n=1 Tax=Roseisolibacter agri TaxID=2014610 RepID=A0AA37V1T5_9BACT|nr:hypothetical protein [Roseisolibacter agri]GLC26755.1 hypothetical protein rosag_32680 [Roseisolibacter agri]
MLHLDPERLAALADEAPTAEEGAHLAHCLACRRERDAYVALLALAQREGRAAADGYDLDGREAEPLTSWASLSTALRAEGLLTSPVASPVEHPDVRVLPLPTARPMASPARRAFGGALSGAALRRVAAAALFVAGGAAAGRVSVGAPALPLTDAAAPAVATADVPAGDALLTAGASSFASVDEASQVLARAQRDYQRAAVFLAEHDSSAAVGSSDVLRARLAALDDMMPRVREALNEAPQDPVLNQVYLTTYDVRESTLRQLGRTLPVGARVNGY